MAKKFIKTIVSLLVFVLVMNVLSPLSQAIEEGKEDESIDFNSTLNTYDIFPKNIDGTSSISSLNKKDIQSFNNEEFEKEFDFLIEDPVFQLLEQVLAKQEVKDAEIKQMWIPVVAAALRVLMSSWQIWNEKRLGDCEAACPKSFKSAEQIQDRWPRWWWQNYSGSFKIYRKTNFQIRLLSS